VKTTRELFIIIGIIVETISSNNIGVTVRRRKRREGSCGGGRWWNIESRHFLCFSLSFPSSPLKSCN
jgi:hypothetical protein